MIGKTLVSAVALTMAGMAAADTADASTFKVIHTFTGTGGDGAHPMAGLIEDSAGNLYGTTQNGGTDGCGTVFELSPPSTAGAPWTETIIYDFGLANADGFQDDGTNPDTALLMDSEGALYGTTNGGTSVVFKLTPPAAGQTAWANTVLYRLHIIGRGEDPTGLTLGADGTLYGTTSAGGLYGDGTLFKLTSQINKRGEWTSEIIHNFKANSSIGSSPWSPVIVDAQGDLFGTTSAGVVFEYIPPPAGRTSGIMAPIYMLPSRGVLYGPTIDVRGALYVTCDGCGSSGYAVLKLTSPASGTLWSASTIHAFAGSTNDSAHLLAGVTFDTKGDLYGESYEGGTYNLGTVFKLTPPKSGNGPWSGNILHSATSGSHGSYPAGTVTVDEAGNVFGAMTDGGSKPGLKGSGVVYQITP